jgi:hypothetical protein
MSTTTVITYIVLGLLTTPAQAGVRVRARVGSAVRRSTPRRSSAAHDWLRTARRGYCEETELDSGASCARGRKGAWKLKAANMANATATCLALCGGCPRCRYISVTANECNWFRDCDLEALGKQASFRSGLFPGRLNSSQDSDGDEGDAPWSLQAAARSRSATWGAGRRIFSPLVASARRVGHGPVGIGAHFGTLKEGYWSYLQITLRAWREKANASLVILTDQAPVLRGRLGQAEDTAGDGFAGLGGLARREQGWGAMAEVIVQPVNVTRMSSSWGIAKELQGATLGPPSLLPPSWQTDQDSLSPLHATRADVASMHAGTDSQWYRHLLLSSFLRLSCMRSRGVLLLDLKDVLVQGPPWPLLAPGRVTVFEEIGLIQNAPWNQCACTAHTAHHRAPQPTPISSLALPCGGVCRATPRCSAAK